jgi:uncharacterized protein (DUF1778 family)
MTMDDMNTQALLLDQTCFALDAEAFDTFQALVDKLPEATAKLRRMLTRMSPWDTTAVSRLLRRCRDN